MKIIDLRPAWERHAIRRWQSGQVKGGLTNPAHRLWSGLADGWLARRVAGRAAPVPGSLVLSVGNLALGGTGKTPVIMALAQALARAGKSGCVLTRGFRSPLAGPLVVQADNGLAGDEARLMAAILAPVGWPVVQGRNRESALRHALSLGPRPDFILIEDGHQTRGVGRHLDILILDRWQEKPGPAGPCLQPVTGPVFPLGPYRETARGAARAGILLVETPDPVPSVGVDGQSVAAFTRRIRLRQVAGTHCAEPLVGPYGVLSGIARPAGFEEGVTRVVGRGPRLALRLRDHQEYDPALVGRLTAELGPAGGLTLVTTAKDWVKLEPFWPLERPVLVADLDVVWGQPNALPRLVEERAALLAAAGD